MFFSPGAGRASPGDWNLRPVLGTIQAPTPVIHGSADAIALASSEAWARAVPGSRFEVIDRAGHFPWLERPEAFFPPVNRFLRRRADGAGQGR